MPTYPIYLHPLFCEVSLQVVGSGAFSSSSPKMISNYFENPAKIRTSRRSGAYILRYLHFFVELVGYLNKTVTAIKLGIPMRL